jgi:flavin reductase (DIM6/NTAB) family NADH-FMN oxidoreductase RutF
VTLRVRHAKLGLMKTLPLDKVFQLIEPSPVVLVSTAHKGCANLMTMSWLLPMEFTPPLIGCVIGPWDYSHAALRATGECVIAIPGVDLAGKVVEIGNCSGREVDKFKNFRLTPRPAAKVCAPLVAECLANLECRLVDTTLSKKYGFLVLKVVRAWTNPARKERRTFHANGDGTFVVDGRTLNLKKKMTKFPQFI